MVGFSRSSRAFAVLTAFALGALAAEACGGQSLVHSDGDSGGSSDGGTGQSGYSGSYDGGTSGVGGTSGYAGTSDYGGTSYGGAPTGGIAGTIEIGGTSYGGAPTGGVAGTSGSAGFAGNGGICSLPFDPGPCRGYATMYGFSEPDGNCQPFVYGGCEGNENRFSTLAECEAKCGGSLNRCGEHTPWGQACMTEGQSCTYDVQDCVCAPKGLTDCVKLDPTCSLPDAGVSAIVIVAYTRCTCANGTWNCQPVTYGGGPP